MTAIKPDTIQVFASRGGKGIPTPFNVVACPHDWKTGLAPFGNKVGEPRTEWNTSDIFLRQNFEYDGTEFKSASIVIFHDEDTEVYVNGQKILGLQGFVNEYNMHHITEALRKAIHKGTNTIAVHTHQTGGGQYIDIALLVEY